jgi:hypothetical protein
VQKEKEIKLIKDIFKGEAKEGLWNVLQHLENRDK